MSRLTRLHRGSSKVHRRTHKNIVPGRWIAGSNGRGDEHVISVFTDDPHRHPLMHASQSDLGKVVGAILDARSEWDTHTTALEIQYSIERALNLVAAPEICASSDSPSNGSAAEDAFRQRAENNGLYITMAWIKPKGPAINQMCRTCGGVGDIAKGGPDCSACGGSRFETGVGIVGEIVFADGERREKCASCSGSGSVSCPSCDKNDDCEQCDGTGYGIETSDSAMRKYPQVYALRRHGSGYSVMYEHEASARTAMAVMRLYPRAMLDRWFSRRAIDEQKSA